MKPLSASELLSVWERGMGQPPFQRALTLLAVACPDLSLEELAQLSIGQRDARLLTLHEWIFGPQLHSLAPCPGCHERLELTFNIAELRAAPTAESGEARCWSFAEYQARYRLPNSLDLAALAASGNIADARRWLVERCLLTVSRQGETLALDRVPETVLEAVIEQIGQADPQADVQLALVCPQCGHQWQMVFDIVSFFWSEIHAWATRILREIHMLASSYGWREADILALSPWRRQCYLNMIST